MASSQPALALDSRTYGSLSRRLGAFLVDLAIALSILFAVAITLRVSRALGLWVIVTPQQLAPDAPGWSPEQIWRDLGVGAKAAVVFAFVLSEGAIYRILFEASAWQAISESASLTST